MRRLWMGGCGMGTSHQEDPHDSSWALSAPPPAPGVGRSERSSWRRCPGSEAERGDLHGEGVLCEGLEVGQWACESWGHNGPSPPLSAAGTGSAGQGQ